MEITEPMESIDYKTLLEISQSTATVRTRDEMQAFIDERVRPCFGFNEVWNICLYEPVSNNLEVLFTNKITPEDSDDFMKFRSPNPAEGFFKIVLESDEIIHLDESWESVPKTSRIEKIAYRFWRDFNIKYCLSVSLRSFGQVIGTFHTFFKEHKTFTESQLQLFKALAAQVAIALVNVLANERALEREREKALLAEERRRRAEELAKSNEVIARASERLNTLSDLSAFLGQVTIEAAKRLNADAGHLTVFEEKDDSFRTVALLEAGELVDGADNVNRAASKDNEFWRELQEMRRPRQFRLETEADLLWQGSAEYHRERNHRMSLIVPLFAADKLLGYLGLSFLEDSPVDEQHTELVTTLAHQAALAIQLTRCAGEAEQAAVAREQEKAARERAASLANTDLALKNSFYHLTAEPDLNEILGHVLREIVGQLGVSYGAFSLYDAATQTLKTQMMVTENETRLAADVPPAELGPYVRSFSIDELPIWERLIRTRLPIVTTRENIEQGVFRGTAEWKLRHWDLKSCITVPFIAGDEPLGTMCLISETRREIADSELELIARLAAHAALAIKLTRLAENARREAEQAAALEERNRIAREMHDVLAQGFTGVIFQLETAKRVFGETTPAKVAEYVTRSIDLAREGLAQARSSVQALRPPAADLQLDLPGLLREKLIALTFDTPVETGFSTTGTPVQFPPETILNLLRIGQEAVVNALRHSEASRITVELGYDGGSVRLRVNDDGIGFDTHAMTRSREGYGLRGMRERAAVIQAELNIESKSGGGTSVTVSFGERGLR